MRTPDFFRSRTDTMINPNGPLAVLATRLPWAQIEALLASGFEHLDRAGDTLESSDLLGPVRVVVGAGQSAAGRPRLPIRLMASLVYLKHSYNLGDGEPVARWSENVLRQFFGGMGYYGHRQPCDPTQIGRFRRAIGEDGMELLLKATIGTAVSAKAAKPAEFERVIVGRCRRKPSRTPRTAVWLPIARHKVVAAAKRAGIGFKQAFAKKGKELRRRAGGGVHRQRQGAQALRRPHPERDPATVGEADARCGCHTRASCG